jgi:hypothetical protein
LLLFEAEGYALAAERVVDITSQFAFEIVEHHLRRRHGDGV